jgi:hypothetical protein
VPCIGLNNTLDNESWNVNRVHSSLSLHILKFLIGKCQKFTALRKKRVLFLKDQTPQNRMKINSKLPKSTFGLFWIVFSAVLRALII